MENVNPSNPYDSLLASLQWDGTHQELFRKRVFEQEGMEEEIEEELNEKKYFQEPETSDKFTSKKSLNLEELDKTENQETTTDENEDETELQTKELNELDEKEKEELLTEDENKKDPFLAHFSETELTEDQVKTWKRPKFQSFQTLQLGEILGTNSPPSIQSLEECETHMKKRLLDQWESSSFKGTTFFLTIFLN